MSLPAKYDSIVKSAARVAGGIGVPGSMFPPLDITAMSLVWIKMTREIAQVSGHHVGWVFAFKLIYATLSGSVLYVGGSKLINSLLHAIPGAGTVTAAGANAIFNYVYTERLGTMLAVQFDRSELDKASLLAMARALAIGVFADLSAEEIADAQNQIEVSDEFSPPSLSDDFVSGDVSDSRSWHALPEGMTMQDRDWVQFGNGCDCGYTPNNCGAGPFCRWQY